MAEINRATLFGKLTPTGFRALEAATVLAKLRGHRQVELVHWLHQLLQQQDSDLLRIVRAAGLDAGKLAHDLTAALERQPTGSGDRIDLAAQLETAMERAWIYASLLFGAQQVRSGHLLVGLAKTAELRHRLTTLSPQFARLDATELSDRFAAWTAGSPEALAVPLPDSAAAPGDASGALPAPATARPALARYTIDLTAEARAGKLDPIVGRDTEIRQVIDILLRRRQNNPMLTGEAGVGKTAVVEGLAQRIVAGDVPPALQQVSLRTLDMGLLSAGASMKGEFEQRLRQVIDEVQQATPPVILFIDEAHTLIGAGGNAGTGDAANLLKPALARGSLRTIGATTWAEYKQHIEKDPALTRRFQPVAVDEPGDEQAVQMLRTLVAPLERHHGVRVADAAVRDAVRLSRRYIPDRQLPDKAVSLLDTACARVAVSRHSPPAELEAARQRIAALESERTAQVRDPAGGGAAARLAQIDAALAEARASADTLAERWQQQRELVASIAGLRTGPQEDGTAGELAGLEAALDTLQGETPLVLDRVDSQVVARVVQDWTGIPLSRMAGSDLDRLLALGDTLKARVVGQDEALAQLVRRIQSARAGLEAPNRPAGVFLLAGPSGVGKTETARALADALYGGERNLITVNMSEFQEAHTVSTLKGAPPGYVGYGKGGVLTEAVRRRPYSVLLLDEVEKAHPDVHELFYQVFDQGWMEDGEGRRIDFKNTLILLTSNVGDRAVAQAAPDYHAMRQALAAPLARVFPPALLGRMTVLPYAPLSATTLGAIVRQQLDRLGARLAAEHGVGFDYSARAVAAALAACDQAGSGARQVHAVLQQQILPEIGLALLAARRDDAPLRTVRLDAVAGDFRLHFNLPRKTRRTRDVADGH